MRKKKFFVLTAVILLLVFLFSLTLIACEKTQKPSDETPSGDSGTSGDTPSKPIKPTPPDDDDEEEEEKLPDYAYDPLKALSYLAECTASDFMSVLSDGEVTVDGKRYGLSLRSNFSESDFKLMLKLTDLNDSSLKLAVYAVNSRLFVQTSDGTVYHIAEADVDYLISVLLNAPDEIKKLLEDALKEVNLNFDDVFSLVTAMLLSYSKGYTYEEVDGVLNEHFSIKFNIARTLGTIAGILGGIKLDIDFDMSVISDIIKLLPKYDARLLADVSGGVLSAIEVKILDNSTGSETVDIKTSVEFSDEGVDIQLPEGLENYKEISLGNINADFSLAIDTGDEGLDLGALIDSFLGDKAIFGKGVLVLKAGVNYTLDAKVALDSNLEGGDADNNLISLVLKAGDKKFASLNYIEGVFYINIEDEIRVAVEYDLKSQIDALVKLVTDAIDNALGTNFNGDSAVRSISLASDGDVIISSDWITVIDKLLASFDFKQFVTVSGDRVDVTVNQAFVDKIVQLAGSAEGFNLPFDINATLKLASYGIEYFQISALDGAAVLKAQNFSIGVTDLSKDGVLADIGDRNSYGKDAMSIVSGLLDDFAFEMNLDLSSVDTTVNVTNIVNNILVASGSELKLPITLDLSKYSGVFRINFAINQGKTSLDNRLMLEVITPDGDMLMSAYVYGGKTYVDLSNLGFMKFVLTNIDLFETVRAKLNPVSSGNTDAVAEAALLKDMPIFNIDTQSGAEIDIDDTALSVTIKNQLILALMRSFMFDAGVDLDIEASADIAGKLSAVIDAGFARIGLDIAAGKESDSPVDISSLDTSSYGEYNAFNAELLVDSILEVQNLSLMVDFYNNSVDTEFDKPTRILLRRSNATQGSKEYLANGLEAPYRSMVLIVYDNWENLNDDNAILFGYIDFDGGSVRVKGTKKLFDIFLANGTAIDIPIDLDVKGLLTDALAGLFTGETDSSVDGGIIDVPEGALPDKDDVQEDTEITDGLTVDSILKAIKLTMTASMDIRVDVDFHGALVSDLLDETIQSVFTDMDLSSITGNTEPVTLNYANDERSTFFNDLYDKIIYPVIAKELGSFVATIAGVLKDTMQSIVNRFLPLPSFDTMTANVCLTQGKLDELNLIASNASSSYGFGAHIFNRNAMDVIYWNGQDTDVYYNKNCGIDPSELFVTQAKMQDNGNSQTTFTQNVTWSINGSTITDWSVLSTYEDGVYTAVGSAFGKTINVRLTVESLAIERVEDIQVKAMREVPDYVTVVFTDGSKRTLYNQTVNYTRGAYDSTEAVKAVPAYVMLGDARYDFTIWLENETLTAEEVVVNAYDYKDVFEKMQNEDLKVLVNGSFYRYVSAEYDFSQFDSLTRDQLISGGEFSVPVIIGKGTDIEQRMDLAVRFTPFEVYGIEIDGKNYVDTDIYEYLAGRAFPEKVTVVGYNGENIIRYTASAEWDLSKVTLDKEGGQYLASLTLNKGEYNEWYIPSVGVKLNEADLTGLVNDTLEIDTMYAFYGGVEFDRLIPDRLDFYTANGQIKKGVPVRIDTSGVVLDLNGGTFECSVTVGEGSYEYVTSVTLVLKNSILSAVNEEISFTYNEYVQSQGAMFADRIEVRLGDEIVEAKVTWFTDDVVFNVPGKYVAYIIIDEGGKYEQRCAVTVNVLADKEV